MNRRSKFAKDVRGESATNTRIVFDSDLYATSNDYQTRSIGNCGQFSEFEFVPNNQNVRAYLLEVHLIRNSANAAPGLGALGLSRYGVCSQGTDRVAKNILSG